MKGVKFETQTISIKKLVDLSSAQWHGIITLRSEIFVTEQQCVYTDPDTSDLDAWHAVIEVDEKLLGYARIYRSETWHIGRIVTPATHRGQGNASGLIKACIDFILNQQAKPEIEMSAQVYLSDFYTNLGFKPIGSMYLEDGIPHLRMCYDLGV